MLAKFKLQKPVVPPCEEWSTMEKLAREKEVVGIYISGHPLDDFKYTIKNFCSKFELLKNAQNLVGKSMLFGGIVTKVDHRTTKMNKGWGIFTIEGYDESYDFKLFDKAYLDFRNILSINQFVLLKTIIKPGWTNQETGKVSEPRIEVIDVQLLHDVLENLCKKITISLNINHIQQDLVNELSKTFAKFRGNHNLIFEILEIDKITKPVNIKPLENSINENIAENEDLLDEVNIEVIETTDENKVVTALAMPSRKIKVKISNELLLELENLQVDFRLN